MSGPRSSRSPRRGERGGITWVTLLIVLAVSGGGYLAWVWLPLYFDHYTVKQVVADYTNQAIKNPDDGQLRREMVQKLHSLGQVDGVDRAGRPIKVPAVDVDERSITWERDTSARTLRIAFEYERQVVYPFLDRASVVVFTLDRTGDLTRADWGPQRN